MNTRYLREREALAGREGEMVEVTAFGGPTQFIDVGPTEEDYVSLARSAFIRGDLTADELEREIERALA